MIILYLFIYGIVMFFLYNRLYNALDVADMTFTDDDGEEFTVQRPVLNSASIYQIIIAIIWTGFSFWFIGRSTVELFYYY